MVHGVADLRVWRRMGFEFQKGMAAILAVSNLLLFTIASLCGGEVEQVC